MKTPSDRQQALSLSELMRIVAELRKLGFQPARSRSSLSARQLRGAVASFFHFRRCMRMALLVHIMSLALMAASWLASPGWYTFTLGGLCFIGFLVFWGISRSHQMHFRELAGTGNPSRNTWFHLLGVPFYALLYFHFEKQMRAELSALFTDEGLTGRHLPAF